MKITENPLSRSLKISARRYGYLAPPSIPVLTDLGLNQVGKLRVKLFYVNFFFSQKLKLTRISKGDVLNHSDCLFRWSSRRTRPKTQTTDLNNVKLRLTEEWVLHVWEIIPDITGNFNDWRTIHAVGKDFSDDWWLVGAPAAPARFCLMISAVDLWTEEKGIRFFILLFLLLKIDFYKFFWEGLTGIYGFGIDFDFDQTSDHGGPRQTTLLIFSILSTIPQVSTVVWYNYRAHLSFRTNFSVSYTSIQYKHRCGNNVWTDLFHYVARSGHPPCGRNNGPLRFF